MESNFSQRGFGPDAGTLVHSVKARDIDARTCRHQARYSIGYW